MSPDSRCWLEQTERAANAYLRALLSNHCLPRSVRNELGSVVLRIQARAKEAVMIQQLEFIPAHLDGAES